MGLNRTTGGGNYFSPKDHMNDVAVLVEPIKINRDVENTYQGQTRKRDEAYADFTIFGTAESVEKGEPTAILSNLKVTQTALASEIGDQIGEQFVAVIKKVPMGAGTGYVFRSKVEDVSDETFAAVEKYLEARNAETEKNLADVPDFD